MAMKNTKITKKLCLCSFMVAWILGFSLKTEAHMKKNNDIKKERKHMKS
jgi:hypothetical protein